jgi:uncharacterized membrane protein HdeD (DUF308 family)
MQRTNNPDRNNSSSQRGNNLFGTFQIILGIFLIWCSFSNKPWNSIQLLPLGAGILSLVYGIFRITGRVKSSRQQPWDFALMICLTLGVMALAYFTRPKRAENSTYISTDTSTIQMGE